MSVGERIKALRLKRGMKQTSLADTAGIQKQTLYKYEQGVITNIPLRTIEALAKALNVSPAYLVGWVDDEEQVKNEVKANERSAKKMQKPQIDGSKRHDEVLIRLLADICEDNLKKMNSKLEKQLADACCTWLCEWIKGQSDFVKIDITGTSYIQMRGKRCSKCGTTITSQRVNYCPNCGAKMPEVKDEEANEE